MKKINTILITLLLLTSCSNASNSTIKTSEEDIIDYSLSTQENIIKDYDEELGVGINQNNFPDEEFIKYIKKNVDIDDNNYLSNEEIDNTKNISFKENDIINNLKGIEYFINLENLNLWKCSNIHEINISKLENIQSLWIEYVPISRIDLSNNKKLENIGFNNTNLAELSIYSEASKITLYIAQTNINTIVDISNCPYLKNNIFEKVFKDSIDDGLYIDFEVLGNENYIEVICDDRIIKHSSLTENHRSCTYFLGQGNNNIVNSTFNTYEEALNYGFNGNKWFEIVTHPYKDGTECTLKDCWTNPESCTYRYEVIVYDEQPF